MRIGGFGELENIRRALMRDDSSRAYARPDPAATPADAKPTDEVQLSGAVQLMGKLRETPDVRADEVARLQKELSDGGYPPAEKLRSAVKRLLADL